MRPPDHPDEEQDETFDLDEFDDEFDELDDEFDEYDDDLGDGLDEGFDAELDEFDDDDDDEAPSNGVDPAESTTRRTWQAAVGLLLLATIVTVLLIAGRVIPAAFGAVSSGVSAVVGAVGDGAREVGESWRGWTGRLESIAEEAVAPSATLPAAAGSDSLLIVVTNAENRGVAFALAARSPEDTTALVLIPPNLLSIIPGFGDFPLAEAPVFEDPELAALTLTNAVGTRIDEVIALGPGDLAAALAGPVVVDLPVPLIVADAQGESGQVLAKSGKAERTASAAETILTTQGESDDPEWLQRQGAVWDGILDAIDEEPIIATRLAAGLAESQRAESVLRALAASETSVVTALPVTQVAIGGSAAAFTIDGDAAPSFVAQRLGHLLIREGDRPRVELLNGNGRIGTTRLVAQELVRRGYRVIKTDNADSFEYEKTQVVAQGRDNRLEAQRVIDVLGTGDLLLEVRTPSGVVDVSIIVGQDIPAGEG